MSARDFALPKLSLRFFPIWRRHWLVWKKIAAPSILGHLADPVIYMLGLGYGLGTLLPEMGGMSYMAFLAAGTVCYSTMNSASFEALYSGFRTHARATHLGGDTEHAGVPGRRGAVRDPVGGHQKPDVGRCGAGRDLDTRPVAFAACHCG